MTSLEDITEIKQEYGIGSKQAFSYLKAREDYMDLTQNIRKKLKGNPNQNLVTYRAVCDASGYAQMLFQLALDVEGTNLTLNEDELRCAAEHTILSVSKYNNYSTTDIGHSWKFNYENFLAQFFILLDIKPDQALYLAFLDSCSNNFKYFSNNDKKFSFKDIISDESIMLEPESKNLDVVIQHSKVLYRGFFEFLENFNAYLESGDLIVIGKRPMNLQGFPDWAYEILVSGLKGEDVYKRAEKDHTLGRLETERRVALNRTLLYEGEVDNDEIIENSLSDLRRQLLNRQDSLEKLISLNGPQLVIDNAKFLIRKSKYSIRVIRNNRRWLERVLSN